MQTSRSLCFDIILVAVGPLLDPRHQMRTASPAAMTDLKKRENPDVAFVTPDFRSKVAKLASPACIPGPAAQTSADNRQWLHAHLTPKQVLEMLEDDKTRLFLLGIVCHTQEEQNLQRQF